jgi:hypothetical protein
MQEAVEEMVAIVRIFLAWPDMTDCGLFQRHERTSEMSRKKSNATP